MYKDDVSRMSILARRWWIGGDEMGGLTPEALEEAVRETRDATCDTALGTAGSRCQACQLPGSQMQGPLHPGGDGARARGRTSFARIDGFRGVPSACGRFGVRRDEKCIMWRRGEHEDMGWF